MYEFQRITRLPPYVFAGVDELKIEARRRGDDIIDFGMGNPDLATPPHIVEKLVEAATNPRNHRYSASRGITRLRTAIANWYGRRYDVNIDSEEEAIVTIGVKEGLSHLALAITNPGDLVMVPSPTYPIHTYAMVLANGNVIHVPLSQGDDFFENMTDIIRPIWPRPKILVLSFPHNPTTVCVDLDFFEKVVAFAKEYNLIVVHDFAYADLGFDGYEPPSILQVKGAKDVSVEFFSLSKSYSMPGWRIGFAVGNSAAHRRTQAHQELPRLRRVPAHPDCFDHRAQRLSGVRRGDLPDLPESPRRAVQRIGENRLACSEAQGHDVRMGRDSRRI